MQKQSQAWSYSVKDGRIREIRIQVSLFPGIPVLQWIGVETGRLQEWKNRVFAALRSSGFSVPRKKICIAFDPVITTGELEGLLLPLSLAILSAAIEKPHCEIRAFGSLSADGTVELPPTGLALIREKELDLLPADLIEMMRAYRIQKGRAVTHLHEAWDLLTGTDASKRKAGGVVNQGHSAQKNPCVPGTTGYWITQWRKAQKETAMDPIPNDGAILPKQQNAWLAILWSLAGKHPLLLCGAPGCGKTHLVRMARRLLPELSIEEQVEKLQSYGKSGRSWEDLPLWSPFPVWSEWDPNQKSILTAQHRNERVYWTTQEPGISGIHLEELAQFSPKNLNCCKAFLGQYGEDWGEKKLWIVGTMNPCPCGQHLSTPSTCTCSQAEKERYWRKLDAALLDRFPIFLPMETLQEADLQQLSQTAPKQQSVFEEARFRLRRCWEMQNKRYQSVSQVEPWNGLIPANYLQPLCQVREPAWLLATQIARQRGMNARGYSNLLRLARTIADWEGREDVLEEDIGMANQFRWRRLV